MHKIPQQIIPLAVLFAVVLAALIVARQLMVPDTFGDYGHYRADATDEIAAHAVVYAGYQACLDCHDDVFEAKSGSKHSGVSCEACHGPAAQHVDAPDEYTPDVPRGRDFCPLCHGYNPSRPSGFPQIISELHNPGKACMTCHDPHEPVLPHAPGECSACHRDIANTKVVSHHAALACVQCHRVPDDHLSNPKFVSAGKPTERSACGQCHATDADSPREIPRIDLESHGERYQCWDCHYPHFPEAN